MTYKTHLLTSLVVALPVMAATDTLAVGNIAALSLGAILPDIDEPGSWIGRRTRGISDLMKRIFGHRGLTHSLIAVGVVTLLMLSLTVFLSLPLAVVIAFVTGYFLHIFEDSFSKSGVAWLLPFKPRKFQSGFGKVYYTTGGLMEWIFFGCMVIALALLVRRLDLSMLLTEIRPLPGNLFREISRTFEPGL